MNERVVNSLIFTIKGRVVNEKQLLIYLIGICIIKLYTNKIITKVIKI